jgi:hypothetical protein
LTERPTVLPLVLTVRLEPEKTTVPVVQVVLDAAIPTPEPEVTTVE